MGKPNVRLNPAIEGGVNRELLARAIGLLQNILPDVPQPQKRGKGRPGWNWQILLILSILMALCKKTYSAYEAEMRTNETIWRLLGVVKLPSKSCLQRFQQQLTTAYLRMLLRRIALQYYQLCADMFADATGFTLNRVSSWFNLQLKRVTRKKDYYKLHIIGLERWQLLFDFRITKGTRHDGPPLRRMLKPLTKIGLLLADGAYACRATLKLILSKGGSPFLRFSKATTGNSKGCMQWGIQFQFFKNWHSLWMHIYNQRSRVESIFSAIKRRYGDHLRGKSRRSRFRELIFRLIAYNLRQALHIEYSFQHNLPLWVRAR